MMKTKNNNIIKFVMRTKKLFELNACTINAFVTPPNSQYYE